MEIKSPVFFFAIPSNRGAVQSARKLRWKSACGGTVDSIEKSEAERCNARGSLAATAIEMFALVCAAHYPASRAWRTFSDALLATRQILCLSLFVHVIWADCQSARR